MVSIRRFAFESRSVLARQENISSSFANRALTQAANLQKQKQYPEILKRLEKLKQEAREKANPYLEKLAAASAEVMKSGKTATYGNVTGTVIMPNESTKKEEEIRKEMMAAAAEPFLRNNYVSRGVIYKRDAPAEWEDTRTPLDRKTFREFTKACREGKLLGNNAYPVVEKLVTDLVEEYFRTLTPLL